MRLERDQIIRYFYDIRSTSPLNSWPLNYWPLCDLLTYIWPTDMDNCKKVFMLMRLERDQIIRYFCDIRSTSPLNSWPLNYWPLCDLLTYIWPTDMDNCKKVFMLMRLERDQIIRYFYDIRSTSPLNSWPVNSWSCCWPMMCVFVTICYLHHFVVHILYTVHCIQYTVYKCLFLQTRLCDVSQSSWS